jgi:hypothetical protein
LLRVVDFIEDFWGETKDAHFDPAYAWLRARLQGEQPSIFLKKEQSD